MAQGVTRLDFQSLSDAKLADAILLFGHGRWGNAFYLAGYAVELALKACATRQILAETLPDRKFVGAVYTHNFDALVGLAGLRADLRMKQDSDSIFSANWGIVAEWLPDARYDPTDKASANLLINAIANSDHGVLPWIKLYW